MKSDKKFIINPPHDYKIKVIYFSIITSLISIIFVFNILQGIGLIPGKVDYWTNLFSSIFFIVILYFIIIFLLELKVKFIVSNSNIRKTKPGLTLEYYLGLSKWNCVQWSDIEKVYLFENRIEIKKKNEEKMIKSIMDTEYFYKIIKKEFPEYVSKLINII